MSNHNLHAGSVTQSTGWLANRKSTWAAPMVVCGLAALAYACTMTRLWDASQAVAVRQDASASSGRPGKFADLYEMRTVQETILELARSQQVIAATLQQVDGAASAPPSAKAVDKFRKRLRMSPPGGAEFGKTEVFYLSIKDADRERALSLVAELCQQLDLRLRQLRSDQRGLITETKAQLDAAEQLLAAETERLAGFEAQVGADLGELRTLNSSWSGQSDLRQKYVALEADCRRFQEEVRETKQLLDLLSAENVEAARLVALPSSLLTAQPALRQLKDGLVNAQLRTARLQGVRSAAHPRVQAAAEAEDRMRRDLAEEMDIARRAAEAELQLRTSRYEAALAQLQAVELRLAELAEKRAEYSNRISALESSRESVDRLRQRLAASQASQAAAQESSVLTPVDQPETGPTPAGPSRAMVVLAGLAGGLVIGVGLIVCQLPQSPVSDDLTIRQQGPSNNRFDATTDPSRPEWWETPADASVEPLPDKPAARQRSLERSREEPVDWESFVSQPDNVLYQDAHADVAAVVATPVAVAPEQVVPDHAEATEAPPPALEDVVETLTDDPADNLADDLAEGPSDESARENAAVVENENQQSVDDDAMKLSEAPIEEEIHDDQVVDEVASDAESEAAAAAEAVQRKCAAEALQQEAEPEEVASASKASSSAPTRTTMPTITFDDESLQEAMRQAFTS